MRSTSIFEREVLVGILFRVDLPSQARLTLCGGQVPGSPFTMLRDQGHRYIPNGVHLASASEWLGLVSRGVPYKISVPDLSLLWWFSRKQLVFAAKSTHFLGRPWVCLGLFSSALRLLRRRLQQLGDQRLLRALFEQNPTQRSEPFGAHDRRAPYLQEEASSCGFQQIRPKGS